MALSTLAARVDEKDKVNFDTFCSNAGSKKTSPLVPFRVS